MTIPALPPPPQTKEPALDGWLYLIWKKLTAAGQILWASLDFTGSNLTDLATRNHADLQNINTATYTHLSATDHTDLTDGGTTSLHRHTNVTLADAAGDTTMFVLLAGAATGDQAILTDSALTYDATANLLAVGGSIAVLTNTKIYLDGVAGTGNTYILESAADVVDLYVGGTKLLSCSSTTETIAGDLVVTGNTTLGDALGDVTKLSGDLIFPKTSGYGVQIDTTSPDFGWHDLLGEIIVRDSNLPTAPHFYAFRSPIRFYQFDLNDEAFCAFHIPHDYVPGTDLYIHIHWGQNETRVSGGTQIATNPVTGGGVSFEVQASYAKGHGQEAFTSPTTALTLTQTASTTPYWHHIVEAQLSDPSPAATQLDTDSLEVDGLIALYVKYSANTLTVSSGNVPDPFIFYVDLHYQSTGIATKAKAPDFYT